MNPKFTRPRKTVTIRLDPALWQDVRAFVRDEAGAPLYQKTGTFAEDALRAHLDNMRRRAAEARRA
jgi:hypothetical protein